MKQAYGKRFDIPEQTPRAPRYLRNQKENKKCNSTLIASHRQRDGSGR